MMRNADLDLEKPRVLGSAVIQAGGHCWLTGALAQAPPTDMLCNTARAHNRTSKACEQNCDK